MPHSLHIGEVATRTGRSVHAIRWYEAQGLVPGVERDGGGRRVYTEHHVGWLEFMDRLRGTGMSVAQMRAYTALVKKGSGALGERRTLLRAHQARVLFGLPGSLCEWVLKRLHEEGFLSCADGLYIRRTQTP